jgi:integrase
VQQKTRQRVVIPVLPALRPVIEATPTDSDTFLYTERRTPFTAPGLGNMMQQWTGEAGLEGCSLHGLRHRFATELAAAGCTPHEISAWTGHRSLREVQRYTKDVDREGLAVRSVERLSKRQSGADKTGPVAERAGLSPATHSSA